jgi:hypothetical protein
VEVVDYTEGISVAFDNAEPSGVVSSIGWFICTGYRPMVYVALLGCRPEGRNLVRTLPFPLQSMGDYLPVLLSSDVPASPLPATGICQG